MDSRERARDFHGSSIFRVVRANATSAWKLKDFTPRQMVASVDNPKNCNALTAGPGPNCSSNACHNPPRITVLLSKLCRVSPIILAIAERETAGLYGTNGIEIAWSERSLATNQPTSLEPVRRGSDRFEVRLLPRKMASRLKLRWDEVGRAMLASDGAFGTIADIYTDRLTDLTCGRKWALGPILGDLIAHESHLLLGPDSHCTGGR